MKNIQCNTCGTKFQRKSHIKNKNYCSLQCFYKSRKKKIELNCNYCNKKFSCHEWEYKKKPRKFCSHSCANSARRGIHYGNKQNLRTTRLQQLKNKFQFKCCMVEGCHYDRCFVLHRFIYGKHGGKYEIGNMFAICPNHHTEVHSNLIKFEKMNDYTLRIKVEKKQYGKKANTGLSQ